MPQVGILNANRNLSTRRLAPTHEPVSPMSPWRNDQEPFTSHNKSIESASPSPYGKGDYMPESPLIGKYAEEVMMNEAINDDLATVQDGTNSKEDTDRSHHTEVD